MPEQVSGDPVSWLPARLSSGNWHVLVSSHYLRFASLPWSSALESTEGRSSYMATRWRQLFGDASADWSLCMQAGQFEQASIMIGWPQRLALLLAACTASGLLVQPLVTAAFSVCAGKLPRDCLFATLEPGSLGLAVVRSGRIESLVTHRIQGDWRMALSQVCRRLCLQDSTLTSLGPIRVLSLLENHETSQREGDGWSLLPGLAPTKEEALALMAAAMHPAHGFNLIPPRRSGRQLERLAVCLAAGLFVLAAGLNLSAAHSQRDHADPVPVVTQASPLSPKDMLKLGREVAAVNRAVSSLNLPADSLISALSPQSLKDVALLSIDIASATEGRARVVGSARNLNSMESYIHQLEQRHDLAQVSLSHHETATSADWPYRFTVEAQWQPQ